MSTEQKLIDESRGLIEFSRDRRSSAPSEGLPGPVAQTVDAGEMIRRSEEDQVEGTATVTIAEDRMTAFVSLYPPRGFGRPLDTSEVYDRLTSAGVVFGIESEVLEAAVYTCNTEESVLHSVEVAFGLPSRHGVRAHLKLATRDRDEPELPSDESVDHRSRSTLSLVRKGEALATEEPEIIGRDGTTVTGETIPHGSRPTPVLAAGENTEMRDGRLIASIPGLLHLENGLVSVRPTLPLAGGVDYRTGNIEFDGDVILANRIADGFTLSCTGTLASSVTIDGFGISCGSLVGKQGLIGHSNAPILVRNDASVRFIQNAHVRVGGALTVHQSVLKSHVTAFNRVDFGQGGALVGSTIRAGLGVNAYHVGAPGAAASEVYLGIDFQIDERLATIRDHTLALSEKLRDVRMILAHGDDKPAMASLEQELQAAIATLAAEAGDLVSHLDRDENAALVVHGTIHAGTYVEICHRSHLVAKTLSRCRFRLDRATGTIVTEKLSAHGEGERK